MEKINPIMSLEELCQVERIEIENISEIVEYGIVEPIEGDELENWIFDTTSIYWIKKAMRLYHDFEINWIAVALLIDLLKKNDSLQKENQRYQRQLARFIENGTT